MALRVSVDSFETCVELMYSEEGKTYHMEHDTLQYMQKTKDPQNNLYDSRGDGGQENYLRGKTDI